jgi:hypothetical protein
VNIPHFLSTRNSVPLKRLVLVVNPDKQNISLQSFLRNKNLRLLYRIPQLIYQGRASI